MNILSINYDSSCRPLQTSTTVTHDALALVSSHTVAMT